MGRQGDVQLADARGGRDLVGDLGRRDGLRDPDATGLLESRLLHMGPRNRQDGGEDARRVMVGDHRLVRAAHDRRSVPEIPRVDKARKFHARHMGRQGDVQFADARGRRNLVGDRESLRRLVFEASHVNRQPVLPGISSQIDGIRHPGKIGSGIDARARADGIIAVRGINEKRIGVDIPLAFGQGSGAGMTIDGSTGQIGLFRMIGRPRGVRVAADNAVDDCSRDIENARALRSGGHDIIRDRAVLDIAPLGVNTCGPYGFVPGDQAIPNDFSRILASDDA